MEKSTSNARDGKKPAPEPRLRFFLPLSVATLPEVTKKGSTVIQIVHPFHPEASQLITKSLSEGKKSIPSRGILPPSTSTDKNCQFRSRRAVIACRLMLYGAATRWRAKNSLHLIVLNC